MKKWKITYGHYCKAVEMLNSVIQSEVPYNLVCDQIENEQFNSVYIHTDSSMEGYSIEVSDMNGDDQRIEIIAEDEVYLLYAVSDFKNKYLPFAKDSDITEPGFYVYKPFEGKLKAYSFKTKPRIRQRGLWTWGFVIYDYKKYIDNMVRLKFNTLIIWNDHLPVNIEEVIAYAHQNGVKIYLGFSWGWYTYKENDEVILHTEALTEEVVEKYEKEFMDLDCDGIYFQSFTEFKTDSLQGENIAEAVTRFVNNTVRRICELSPDIKLLFGLHATSVKNRLDIIKEVDERVSIIWEDMGAFPYSYHPGYVDGFEETLELTRKTRDLRNGGFGTVLKGISSLDWTSFEHQGGKFVLGSCDKAFLANRLMLKKEVLKRLQAYWIKNADYAYQIVREFKEDSMVTILAEDAMFEELINYPLALYSEMLWDSERDLKEIMFETAMMTDVEMI